MKEIRLMQLKLKNFKGIKDLTINFNGKSTNIYGANATGKTSVFDAFKWILFDKDSTDRKNFNIKTLDNSNKQIHFLEHEVEIILQVDGVNITFRKMLKEKWIKKRGQSEQEYAGNETSYWVDEVPIAKKEYEDKVSNIIKENLFKLVTDALYFNNMKWQDKRELLLKIANVNISDEDILRNNEELQLLLDKLEGRSIKDYQKVLESKIKAIKEDIAKIPVRIDEATMSLSDLAELELINFDELKEERTKYKSEIEKIDNIFLDFQAKVSENNAKLNSLSTKKIELSTLQNKLENEQKIQLSNRKIAISNKINEINNKIKQKESNIGNLEVSISKFKKQREELREQWTEINNKQFEEPENEFICPTCKQELTENQKQQKLDELKNNFLKQKQSELDNVNIQGTKAKENQEQYEEELIKTKDELDTLQKELEILNKEIVQVDDDINSVQVADYKENEDYKRLLNEIEQLEKQVIDITSITADEQLKEQKAKLQVEVERINSIFARKENIEKTQARIAELEKQEEELAQQIQNFEQQQYLIEKFTVTKVELVEQAINNKFKVAKFKLFNTLINGGIEETCVTLINGVDFPDANHAAQILVGLDIIETFNAYYNISAPVFIDNSEAISSQYNINTQLIKLTVSNDRQLRIEVDENNEIEVQDVKQSYEH